jgi:hypothetical protein
VNVRRADIAFYHQVVGGYLGANQFGLFSYAIAFAAIFSSIAKMGITEDVMSANRILNT